MRGLDADTVAAESRTDPIAIGPVAEAAAVLSGLRTFDARPAGGRIELDYRDNWARRRGERYPVLPEHRCGTEWPGDTITAILDRKRATPDACPF